MTNVAKGVHSHSTDLHRDLSMSSGNKLFFLHAYRRGHCADLPEAGHFEGRSSHFPGDNDRRDSPGTRESLDHYYFGRQAGREFHHQETPYSCSYSDGS